MRKLASLRTSSGSVNFAGQSRGRRAVAIAFAALLGSAVVPACKPSPEFITKWANTEGSEEKFKGYLLDPKVPMETRVRALELLIEQWDHSSNMMRGGALLKEIPDVTERNAILKAAIPKIRSLYDGGGPMEYKMRDAAYHLMEGSEDPENRAALQAILQDWVVNKWLACKIQDGEVRVATIMNLVGAEVGAPKIAQILNSGSFDDAMCVGREIKGDVTWLATNDLIAEAYTKKWDAGIQEADQLKFEFLEAMLRLTTAPKMRAWMFTKVNDPNLDGIFKNAMLDSIDKFPTPADDAEYVKLLTNETYARWSAFRKLVDSKGSEGLELVLNTLPATGEYAYYDMRIRPDGFKNVADKIVCTIPRLTELGDNARQVFERHLNDANLPVRALSIHCLTKLGNAATIAKFNESRATLPNPVPVVPGWGGINFAMLLDQSVLALQTKLAAPPTP